MKGRGDTRGGPGNRGRGYYGRGARGMAKQPARTGTNPLIGAYLDSLPGRDINPGMVTTWIAKMGEYVMTSCESKINLIFGPDGTLGAYPVITPPADPVADASRTEQKKWEARLSEYNKERITFEHDKEKVFGLMLGQMSENSKNRIKETIAGNTSLENHDPRRLLHAIISTHMTDNRLDAEHNLFKINQAFNHFIMQPNDTLAYYYQRFRALLSGLHEAYTRAVIPIPTEANRELQLALKFTMGLNTSYNVYKQYYEDSVRPWPTTLTAAFQDASRFQPRRSGGANDSNSGANTNAFAMRGRGRGRGRGGRNPGGRDSGQGRYQPNRGNQPQGDQYETNSTGGSEYGTRKGNCHNCDEPGHYSYECRAKDRQKMGAGGAQVPTGAGMQKGK